MFGVPNSGALYRSLSYTVTSVADRVHTNKGFSRDVVIVTNPHADIIARRAEDACRQGRREREQRSQREQREQNSQFFVPQVE